MAFDSDSSHLHMDSCVAGGMKGVKSAFVEGHHAEVAERSSLATTGKDAMIGEYASACTFKDDTGKLCTLKSHMTHAPSSKHRPMSPQWLSI